MKSPTTLHLHNTCDRNPKKKIAAEFPVSLKKRNSMTLNLITPKKKLKNALTAKPHSPYHTPKHSQSSQSDQSQKKRQQRNNYEKKNPKPITLLVPTL